MQPKQGQSIKALQTDSQLYFLGGQLGTLSNHYQRTLERKHYCYTECYFIADY